MFGRVASEFDVSIAGELVGDPADLQPVNPRVREGLDAAKRGDFASDEQIAEVFDRFRRPA